MQREGRTRRDHDGSLHFEPQASRLPPFMRLGYCSLTSGRSTLRGAGQFRLRKKAGMAIFELPPCKAAVVSASRRQLAHPAKKGLPPGREQMTSNQEERGDADRERLSSNSPRRRRPSAWRCLLPLRFGGYAIVVLLFLEGVERVICEIVPPITLDARCPTIGPWLSWVAMSVIVLSAITCMWTWWHDFNRRKRRQLGGRRL